jgi:hypothetical protein
MEVQKLRIRTATAFAELKAAYEAKHAPLHFDVIVQAHLHCHRLAGISSPYDAQIDALEALESQLEEVTKNYVLPRWRARRLFMSDMIKAGKIIKALSSLVSGTMKVFANQGLRRAHEN